MAFIMITLITAVNIDNFSYLCLLSLLLRQSVESSLLADKKLDNNPEKVTHKDYGLDLDSFTIEDSPVEEGKELQPGDVITLKFTTTTTKNIDDELTLYMSTNFNKQISLVFFENPVIDAPLIAEPTVELQPTDDNKPQIMDSVHITLGRIIWPEGTEFSLSVKLKMIEPVDSSDFISHDGDSDCFYWVDLVIDYNHGRATWVSQSAVDLVSKDLDHERYTECIERMEGGKWSYSRRKRKPLLRIP
ncbi:uncharacterized protein LOC142353973 [Convolutriloba macropyga]|uniref:uncharacterized protein LOC142353973 n=1 Tax=Convolutriloba macropyga TaxID=536237 RepID=UPI003F51E500